MHWARSCAHCALWPIFGKQGLCVYVCAAGQGGNDAEEMFQFVCVGWTNLLRFAQAKPKPLASDSN